MSSIRLDKYATIQVPYYKSLGDVVGVSVVRINLPMSADGGQRICAGSRDCMPDIFVSVD